MAPVWVTHVVLGTDRTVSLLRVMYRNKEHTADGVGETWNAFRFVTRNHCVLYTKEARFCCTPVQTLRVETAIWGSVRDSLPKNLFRFKAGERNLFFLESF
jgi:hypothetical protein